MAVVCCIIASLTLGEAPATAMALVMQFAAQSSVLATENSVITNILINKMAVTNKHSRRRRWL